MPNEAEWMEQAVALIKDGHAPEVVHAQLIARGATNEQARAIISPLLELKRQADAADPKRLSAEAAAMIAQGAPYDHVIFHLTSRGIQEQHARPEVDRLIAAHQRAMANMRTCDRCRAPMAPADSYFDRFGNQVCERCNRQDDLGAAEMRVEAARLEAAGVSAWQVQQNQQVVFCPRCQDLTGVVSQATHFIRSGAAIRTFQCTRCGQVI